MGFLWDLIQHSQINAQGRRSDDIDTRVTRLEAELADTRQTLAEALKRLEARFGEDLDRDGKIG